MTGAELIAYMRESMLDDVEIPYLWSDQELLRFLVNAEKEACRRSYLIIDATTVADNSSPTPLPVCVIRLTAGVATYAISPKILQIKRCQLASYPYEIKESPIHLPYLDDEIPDWMGSSGTVGTEGTGGYPVRFFTETGSITFVKAPPVADTAYLVVARLPLTSFTLETSPEIDEKYHINICDWAAHLAFMKPDSDTFNKDLAVYYEARFTKNFGPLPDAYSEQMRKIYLQRARMRPVKFGS